jgi:phosphatidylglycerophosphatase A
MKERLSVILGSAFYIGFIPGAPGTYASIATTLAYYGVFRLSGRILAELHLSVLGFVIVLGVLASTQVSLCRKEKDPSVVVIDEVAGQLLTFLFLPVHQWNLILGTLYFRVFDVWKPFPARQLESLKGGVGIMADDLMAGVYANLLLHVTARLLHW